MASKIPVGKIVELVQKGVESAKSVSRPLRLEVQVDPKVPRWIALAVKDAFDPQQGGATVNVSALAGAITVPEDVDAAVVLAGGSESLTSAAVYSYLGSGVHVAVVAESALDTPDVELTDQTTGLYQLVCASERQDLLDGLAEWVLDVSADPVSTAANFEFCRGLEVERLINRCALQNAGVGAVDLIHGADLPVMAGNQVKLAFDIAAAHGQGLSADRALDAAMVVASAFLFRAAARGVMGRVPVMRFAVRGAIGYGGTVLTGRAIEAKVRAQEGTLELADLDPLSWAQQLAGKLGLAAPGHAEAAATDAPRLAAPEPSPASGYVTYE